MEELLTTGTPDIYLGPNIFALSLKKFQVFSNGRPAYMRRAIEKIPEIESLIVSVNDLTEMRTKIEKSGTAENKLYKKIFEAGEKLRASERGKK